MTIGITELLNTNVVLNFQYCCKVKLHSDTIYRSIQDQAGNQPKSDHQPHAGHQLQVIPILDISILWKCVSSGSTEVRCPAWQMLVSDVTMLVKWRCLVLLPAKKASNVRTEVSGANRYLAFKRRWQMCSSSFCTTCSQSFALVHTVCLFFFKTKHVKLW